MESKFSDKTYITRTESLFPLCHSYPGDRVTLSIYLANKSDDDRKELDFHQIRRTERERIEKAY